MSREVIITAVVVTLTLIAMCDASMKCFQCNSRRNSSCSDDFEAASRQHFLQECERHVVEYDKVSFKFMISFANCTANDTVTACKLKALLPDPHSVSMPSFDCTDDETIEDCAASISEQQLSFNVSYPAVNCRKMVLTSKLQVPSVTQSNRRLVPGQRVRIIRQCGYFWGEDPKKDKKCYRASVPPSSSARYCTCTTEACNASSALRVNRMLMSSIAIVLLVQMIRSFY